QIFPPSRPSKNEKLLRTSDLSGCPEKLFLPGSSSDGGSPAGIIPWLFQLEFRLYGGIPCRCRLQVLSLLLAGFRGLLGRLRRVPRLAHQIQDEFPLRIFAPQMLALPLQVPLDPLEEFL